MNTQAHLMIAAAIFCRPNTGARTSAFRASVRNAAILLGAIVADISLVLMWASAKLRGIDEKIIWEELYYSDYWQNIGAMTNSIPLYMLLTLLGLTFIGASGFRQAMGDASTNPNQRTGGSSANLTKTITPALAIPLLLFAAAALLHCLSDLPLHAGDGHPHFWPFTLWIYSSPVSYWDPEHFGLYWLVIEFLIVLWCVIVLFRRYPSMWVKGCLLLPLLAYPVVYGYWMWSLA